MSYPEKPTGDYELRDYNFAINDNKKTTMSEYMFKNGWKNALESENDSVPDAHHQNWLFDVLYRNVKYSSETADENKYLLETKVATPTSIGQVKVGYGLEVSSTGLLSVQKSIAENASIVSYDLPVGSYMLWAGSNTPEYFIEPAGQTLLRSSYPELWQFAQSNSLVGKLFGAGDGSTTFTVTDIRGNFISIANSNDKIGRFTEAGLPDHTHTETRLTAGGTIWSGTNLQAGYNAVTYPQTSGANGSSVYGKSNTVMPANWGLKLILKALPTPPSNAVPTGTILNHTSYNPPQGYIVANGAELSRSTFSNLFQWASANNLIAEQSAIPNTPHAYYGTGDGSNTFTIPDLRGVFSRYADLSSNRGGSSLGAYQEDGLPNITGRIDANNHYQSSQYTQAFGETYAYIDGCFEGIMGVQYDTADGTLSHSVLRGFRFDASRSSSIYGKSNYVQPKNVSIVPILKY